ncbi:MAG: TonB family protein [Polyangiales bacterium]
MNSNVRRTTSCAAAIVALSALFVAPATRADDKPSVVLVPPQLLEDATPEYPAGKKASGESANVVVTLIIDATGKVTDAVVATSGGQAFDDAALVAAKKLVFSPATRDDKPIPAKISYTFTFAIEKPIVEAAKVVENGALRGSLLSSTDVPLPGATITLLRDGKVVATRTSDETGAFAFTELPPGAYRITIASQGFAAISSDEQVSAKSVTTVTYRATSVGDGVEIDVTGKRPPREVTVHSIEGEEIKKIPGTNGDALRAVENMPGVARPPNGLGMLIVRGSGPFDTGVFVDGTAIPIAYHFGALTSVFPSEVLEKIDFYPGNFGSELGRQMGGVVDVRLRSPKKSFAGLLQFDLLDGRFLLEGPLSPKTRFLVAARRSWVDAWIGPVMKGTGADVTAAPVYYDGQFVLEHDVSETTTARFTAFGSSDRLALIFNAPPEGDPITGASMKTRFFRLQLRTDTRLSEYTRWTNMVSWGIDDTRMELGDRFLDLTSPNWNARSDVRTKISEGVTLVGGLDMQFVSATVDILLPPIPKPGEAPSPSFARPANEFSFSASLFRPAGYASVELTPTKGLKLIPGARADWSNDTSRWAFSPRFVGRWDITDGYPRTTLKGGVGVYQQPPQAYESVAPYGTPGLRWNRALHYALGVEQELSKVVEVSVEGFYKDLRSLVVQRDAASSSGSGASHDNSGTGRVYGAELLARWKNDGRFFGWIAYTLSRSERRDGPGSETRLFEYDQTHILTALASYKVGSGWQLGARWRYVTGSPYTPYVGGIADLDAGGYAAIAGRPFSARNEAFHQLDLRVDKTWKVGSGSITAYLDLQNAYNRKNPEGRSYNYNYSQNRPLAGLPLLPIIGVRGEL